MATLHWDDLRYFAALARHSSLSATARELQVEHATVSRRVSALEKALGLKLFDRLARGWRLTPEGLALLPRASVLEDEVEALRRAAQAQPSLTGSVRVSAPPALLSQIVLPELDAYCRQYPQIALTLIGERKGARLAQGEAEIALRMAEPKEPDLVKRSLGQVVYGLYGTRANCTLPEVNRRFIGFDERLPNLSQKRWLDEQVGDRRVVLRSNDIQAMCVAAAQGLGIAMLPRFLARTQPTLESLAVPSGPLRVGLNLVMHADVRRAARVRHTADWLVSLFERAGDTL